MKSPTLLLLFAVTSALAQGTFQNLDFEDAVYFLADIPSGQYAVVPFSNAFPGWTGYIGTDQAIYVSQNNSTLGAPAIDIWGPLPVGSVIDGTYELVLQPGVNPPAPPVSASITQTGLVPATARSIEFKADAGNFSVSLAGQPINLLPIGSGPNYTLYGGDISQFAGQVAELRITVNPPPGSPNGIDFFDDIVFSPSTIPEPSAVALVALGTTLLTGRFLRPSAACS